MSELKVTKVFFKDHNKGSLKAWADVQFNNTLIVKGWKVFDGKNGLFIAEPSEAKEVDGETKYYPRISFPNDWYGKDGENPVFDAILDEYKSYKGKGSSKSKPSESEEYSDMPY